MSDTEPVLQCDNSKGDMHAAGQLVLTPDVVKTYYNRIMAVWHYA